MVYWAKHIGDKPLTNNGIALHYISWDSETLNGQWWDEARRRIPTIPHYENRVKRTPIIGVGWDTLKDFRHFLSQHKDVWEEVSMKHLEVDDDL